MGLFVSYIWFLQVCGSLRDDFIRQRELAQALSQPSGALHIRPWSNTSAWRSALFENAISRSDRLVGSASRQTAEQFREARLVRIAHGTLAIGLDPFGMLDSQIVVNLLLELSVSVDLVIHRNRLGAGFKGAAGRFPQRARRNRRRALALSARATAR